MNGTGLALGVAGVLAVAGAARRGSRDVRQRYRQSADGLEVYGPVFDDPKEAFDHIALGFLGDDYWRFLGVEDGDEEGAKGEIWSFWKRHGVRGGDLVFAWDGLIIERQKRGRGLGRETVRRIEFLMATRGVRAVVLQAGQPEDDSGPSLGFWEKMGYHRWPGDYGWYEDKILFKVLPR